MILLMALLVAPMSFASSVYFADSCSREEVKIATPNGTTLAVNLSHLHPEENIKITVTYRPAGIIEDLKPHERKTYTYNLPAKRIQNNGTLQANLKIPDVKWMWQVEQKYNEYRIWDAEVSWTQNTTNKIHSAITTFYRAPKSGPYFELLSPSLCHWESKAEIDSKLYENNTHSMMNIIRESSQEWEQTFESGFSLGHNNNTEGSLPIGSISSGSFGWLFKEWQNQNINRQNISIDRKYVLNKDESGVFITRTTFSRHEVRKFQWNPKATKCGSYEEVAEGYLDVGLHTEDFIVIPKNLYGRRQELDSFIELVRPSLSSCQSQLPIDPRLADDIIPSGQNGILYFYNVGRY